MFSFFKFFMPFALGVFSTLIFQIIFIFIFLHWIPYYIWPRQSQIKQQQKQQNNSKRDHLSLKQTVQRDVNIDNQNVDDYASFNVHRLQKEGWIILSTSSTLLTREDLNNWNYLIQKQTTHYEKMKHNEKEDYLFSPTRNFVRKTVRVLSTNRKRISSYFLSSSKSTTFTRKHTYEDFDSSPMTKSASLTSSPNYQYEDNSAIGEHQFKDDSINALSSSDSPKNYSPDSVFSSPKPTKSETRCFHQLLYARLKGGTLFLYASDQSVQTENSKEYILPFIDAIILSQYKVELYPKNLADYEIYLRHTPVKLSPKALPDQTVPIEKQSYYIYLPSGSEKEDWYLSLRRVSTLNLNSRNLDTYETYLKQNKPMQMYLNSMDKLIPKVKNPSSELQTTAWLNAILGRIFVGVHSSPRIKNWLMNKVNRRSMAEIRSSSFLSDIEIRDINVGDSLPLLSNAKLVDISTDGDMSVDMDIEYTGGVRIEAATIATISVPSLDKYVRPIEVPIVIGISIKHFSARVLMKIKPFWETGRIWFGFYKDPGISLRLAIEPIISNQHIRFELVNQIIERRIKDAIEEFLVLPNMDDLPFWPTDKVGGIFEEDEEELREYQEEFEQLLDRGRLNDYPHIDEIGNTYSQDIQTHDMLIFEPSPGKEEGMVTPEFKVKTKESLWLKSSDELNSLENEKDLISCPETSAKLILSSQCTNKKSHMILDKNPMSIDTTVTPTKSETSHSMRKSPRIWDSVKLPEPPESVKPVIQTALGVLTNKAVQYKLDEKFRSAVDTAVEYGLDDAARSLADTAKHYGEELFSFIRKKTPQADPSPLSRRASISSTASSSASSLHRPSSTLIEMFGVHISTSAPNSPNKLIASRSEDKLPAYSSSTTPNTTPLKRLERMASLGRIQPISPHRNLSHRYSLDSLWERTIRDDQQQLISDKTTQINEETHLKKTTSLDTLQSSSSNTLNLRKRRVPRTRRISPQLSKLKLVNPDNDTNILSKESTNSKTENVDGEAEDNQFLSVRSTSSSIFGAISNFRRASLSSIFSSPMKEEKYPEHNESLSQFQAESLDMDLSQEMEYSVSQEILFTQDVLKGFDS